MAIFGRKKVAGSDGGSGAGGEGDSATNPKNLPGHQAVLRHLREKERSEPGVREQLAGRILFDFIYDLMKDDRGVRIENMLAALASVGGQECLAPIIEAASPDATAEQMGLTVVRGNDGRLFFFGDPPNRLLIESPDSLISLAFGTAQALGAPVTMDMIRDEMRLVASRVGTPEFELLDLPAQHMVDRPSEWARVFRGKLAEPMDLYDVPPMRRASTIGNAIQRAMITAKDSADPMMCAQVVLKCATRTSKILIPAS